LAFSGFSVIVPHPEEKKPLVAGSNPAAATNKHKSPLTDQGITQIPQAYPHINSEQGLHLEQAVKGFLNLG